MNDSAHGVGQRLAFRVPTAGGDPETYAAADLSSPSGIALLLFLRHHHCALSRKRARSLEAHAEEFDGVTVAAVLPDTADRASVWHRRYDLSFPLLADPEFEQFEGVTDWVPQPPAVARVDTRGEAPTVEQLYSGARPQDCPTGEEMVDIVAEARREGPTTGRGFAD